MSLTSLTRKRGLPLSFSKHGFRSLYVHPPSFRSRELELRAPNYTTRNILTVLLQSVKVTALISEAGAMVVCFYTGLFVLTYRDICSTSVFVWIILPIFLLMVILVPQLLVQVGDRSKTLSLSLSRTLKRPGLHFTPHRNRCLKV